MKFINFLRDTIYDLYQYILMLIILGVVVFVLHHSITTMFTTDYNKIQHSAVDQAKVAETREEKATDFSLTIPENFSTLDISKILVDAQVITNEEQFIHYINENKLSDKLLPGQYVFHKNMTPEEIISVFEQKK